MAKCPECGARVSGSIAKASSGDLAQVGQKKMVAGILAILLGCWGIHKFYLGMTTPGVVMVLVSLLGGVVTCGAATVVMWVISIVEGVMYLTKSDEDFYRTYIVEKKGWF